MCLAPKERNMVGIEFEKVTANVSHVASTRYTLSLTAHHPLLTDVEVIDGGFTSDRFWLGERVLARYSAS